MTRVIMYISIPVVVQAQLFKWGQINLYACIEVLLVDDCKQNVQMLIICKL